MKTIIAFFFAVFFASTSLAQDQIQQTPPSVQTDTTSGWQLVFSNPRYSIGELQYFPENTVYATAYNGSIKLLMRSFDGGINWDTLTTPIPIGITYFISLLVGFSVPSSQNVVWKTTDGGGSWVAHDRNSISHGPIAFANKDTGVIFSASTMAITTDAGETWKEIFPPNDIDKHDASFADSKVGYAVGSMTGIAGHPTWPDAGYCQKTTDGGATWSQVYTGIPHYLYCCKAINQNIVIVGGTEGTIGRSIDGGNNWDTIKLNDNFPLIDHISFYDSLQGMISCYKNTTEGIVYATSDGGKTWHLQIMPKPPILLSVQMITNNIALTCGGGNIYRTTNGGNFSSVTQHTMDFHVQTFPNPSTGIVTIQYQLPISQSVSFSFYNLQGVTVGSIDRGMQNLGSYQVTFDGSALSNGVYYFRLTTPQNSYTGSFTIQK